MKKIFISLLAVVALAACTKSGVEYTQPEEIGFNIVSGKMTKAAVTNTTYPEALNMYVFAATTDNANGDANYINKGEFAYNKKSTDSKNLWAGWKDGAHYPYYWPNVKQLYFAGVSKSGNVADAVCTMDFNNDKLTITGYEPGLGITASGDNDLMWFSKTAAYGKDQQTGQVPEYVHVDMYHACSWITVKLYGDDVTKNWTIDDITINGLTVKGNVDCVGTTASWTLSTATDDINKTFNVFHGTKNLTTSVTAEGYENVVDNTIVLPQPTTNMDITYSYNSPAGAKITEKANVSLAYSGSDPWKAGYHYTYTVKITASEILIQPDAKTWTEQTVPGVEL